MKKLALIFILGFLVYTIISHVSGKNFLKRMGEVK